MLHPLLRTAVFACAGSLLACQPPSSSNDDALPAGDEGLVAGDDATGSDPVPGDLTPADSMPAGDALAVGDALPSGDSEATGDANAGDTDVGDTLSGDAAIEPGDSALAGDDAPATDTDLAAIPIDSGRIYDDVAWLSHDDRGGRAPATPGNEAALAYVEAVFSAIGLTPAGDSGGFRQAFSYSDWAMGPGSTLSLDGSALAQDLDFAPFEYSGAGSVSGTIVFAGYGLTVPPYNAAQYPGCPIDPVQGYDDYDGLDVTGRVVLVMRHGPSDDLDIHDNCPGTAVCGALPCLWTFNNKAQNAAEHGASAMLLVNDYRHGGAPEMGVLDSTTAATNLPAVFVDRGAVETALPSLPAWAAAIDAAVAGAGQETTVPVDLVVDAQVATTTTSNLLGMVPGADPALGDEIVVIGGHIDHLGTDFATGEVYNGADDNASGTAVVMELARALTSSGVAPARTVLFAAWNAEELGLIGSCHYVGAPTLPLADMVAAFSVDMVGAGDGSGLLLYGGLVPEHQWLGELMASSATAMGLTGLVTPDDRLDASDHVCFDQVGIPAVLAYSRGPHPNYHQPEDEVDGILEADLDVSAKLMWAVLQPLAMGTEATFRARPHGRFAPAPRNQRRPETQRQ